MSRGEAWHFAAGRLLERADKTSRILDVKYFLLLPNVADVGTPLDTIQWAALLKSASALEMYRKRHGRITPTQVAEFLILDRDFPRAMHFCLLQAEESLLAITGSQPGTFARRPSSAWAGCGRNSTTPTSTRSSTAACTNSSTASRRKLNRVGEAISETFFASSRPLAQRRCRRHRRSSRQTQSATGQQTAARVGGITITTAVPE